MIDVNLNFKHLLFSFIIRLTNICSSVEQNSTLLLTEMNRQSYTQAYYGKRKSFLTSIVKTDVECWCWYLLTFILKFVVLVYYVCAFYYNPRGTFLFNIVLGKLAISLFNIWRDPICSHLFISSNGFYYSTCNSARLELSTRSSQVGFEPTTSWSWVFWQPLHKR